MLYERLLDIYKETECHKDFPVSVVESLNEFVISCLHRGNKAISPYKFASYYGITIEEAIRLFLYFSNEQKALKIIYFLCCSKSECGGKTFINETILYSSKGVLSCGECSTEYLVKDVYGSIVVSFKLSDSLFELVKDEVGSKGEVNRDGKF
ncbi:hypothetical protein NDS46_30680 (plasmid) [Paenibacillus thiaminolyticus]|uniref:hypothetical protein n=1 Tax=Paenibacillus thiaminolyticus TaxID=49283 RepID=UPI00232E2420|nr:hypothetical protein [Paenibacillus thiaminolyticus]WCF11714.1 hypothetical protein NDS46_30680 [Paenibacillus thiaminolyticus]